MVFFWVFLCFSHFFWETICFVFQIYYFYLNRLCAFSINQLTVALFTILKVLGNCTFIFQLVKSFLLEGFISLFWSNMPYCFCPFPLYFCHLVLMLAGFAAIKCLNMMNFYIYLKISCLEDRISSLYSWLCCCLFSVWHLADHLPFPWMILLSFILGY